MKRIAIQGELGSFHDIAAHQYFGDEQVELICCATFEEVFENREQIEISRYYEKLPKPTLLATQEYIEGNVYWRDPAHEEEEL